MSGAYVVAARSVDRAVAHLVEAERALPAGHPQVAGLADTITSLTRIRQTLHSVWPCATARAAGMPDTHQGPTRNKTATHGGEPGCL